jgi:Lipid A 3-O-deacylase (PagL)
MMTACLLVWCLGGPIERDHRVTFANDVRHSDRTERIFAYEFPWVVVGAVGQTTERNAVFAGALPLNIQTFRGHLMFAGGMIAASAAVPADGTHANFVARVHIRIIDRVSVAYWHFSNGNLGRRNPSVDSLGVTIQLRQ